MPTTYLEAPTQRVTSGNGIEYAYRDVGQSDIPLVLLIHFRGNLDNWDPALIDALAANDHEHGARRDRLHRSIQP